MKPQAESIPYSLTLRHRLHHEYQTSVTINSASLAIGKCFGISCKHKFAKSTHFCCVCATGTGQIFSPGMPFGGTKLVPSLEHQRKPIGCLNDCDKKCFKLLQNIEIQKANVSGRHLPVVYMLCVFLCLEHFKLL